MSKDRPWSCPMDTGGFLGRVPLIVVVPTVRPTSSFLNTRVRIHSEVLGRSVRGSLSTLGVPRSPLTLDSVTHIIRLHPKSWNREQL